MHMCLALWDLYSNYMYHSVVFYQVCKHSSVMFVFGCLEVLNPTARVCVQGRGWGGVGVGGN